MPGLAWLVPRLLMEKRRRCAHVRSLDKCRVGRMYEYEREYVFCRYCRTRCSTHTSRPNPSYLFQTKLSPQLNLSFFPSVQTRRPLPSLSVSATETITQRFPLFITTHLHHTQRLSTEEAPPPPRTRRASFREPET